VWKEVRPTKNNLSENRAEWFTLSSQIAPRRSNE